MPSDDTPPSRTALRALPYALPVAAGIACLAWSLTEFVATVTDSYWVATELLPTLVGVTVGAGFLIFGGVGALACVERAA